MESRTGRPPTTRAQTTRPPEPRNRAAVSTISLFVGVLVVSLVATLTLTQFVSLGSATSLAAPSSEAGDVDATPELSPTELLALAESATVRVAARTCDGLIRGSGFVVDGSLITNRHLTVGTEEIKVDDPVSPIFVPVTRRSDTLDIALAHPVASLPLSWASAAPEGGEVVFVAGHSGGGPVVVRQALVETTVPEGSFGLGGPVLLLDVETTGGFSGGPVLNTHGHVVGVLQGFDLTTGSTLAIPASAVAGWVESVESAPAAPCPAGG